MEIFCPFPPGTLNGQMEGGTDVQAISKWLPVVLCIRMKVSINFLPRFFRREYIFICKIVLKLFILVGNLNLFCMLMHKLFSIQVHNLKSP